MSLFYQHLRGAFMLAGLAYNERRRQCEEGATSIPANHPEAKNLRGVSPELLASFTDSMDPLVYQRCKQCSMNACVEACCDAIERGDIAAIGSLLYQSHDSLRATARVGPELIFRRFTRALPNVAGARMMQRRLCGRTINLIRSEGKEAFLDAISKAYFRPNGHCTEGL
ncbi:MAG: hypothetical protein R3B47_08440 [Bacteroidia bacterium]